MRLPPSLSVFDERISPSERQKEKMISEAGKIVKW